MVVDGRYGVAWRDLRRRQRIMFIALFCAICATVWRAEAPGDGAVRAQLTFVVVSGLSIAWYIAFRCPRCGNRFFYRFVVRSVTGRKCMHCGLPRNAPFDPG
jgi:hypothetical protein